MDIMKYKLFADIADTKSFTKSGKKMGYTQPAVSHILKTMESEIGFPLFSRTKQSVSLTSNAREILPYVRKLLAINEQLEQTINALNGFETGHLTIAAFASVSRNWLPRLIRVYEQNYPGIQIELMEGGTDEIVNWLKNSIADFGILSRPRTESFSWIKLADDPLMAILPKDYHCADGAFPIREMAEKPFIISAEGVDYDMHRALGGSGVVPNIHLSCKDDHSIVSMVSSGLGISILPKLVIRDMEFPIKALPLEPDSKRELGIAFCLESGLTPAARKFIKTIQETLPELLDD